MSGCKRSKCTFTSSEAGCPPKLPQLSLLSLQKYRNDLAGIETGGVNPSPKGAPDTITRAAEGPALAVAQVWGRLDAPSIAAANLNMALVAPGTMSTGSQRAERGGRGLWWEPAHQAKSRAPNVLSSRDRAALAESLRLTPGGGWTHPHVSSRGPTRVSGCVR